MSASNLSGVDRYLYVAEPPATYMVRPALVIDCSVLSAFMFDEETRDKALALMAGKTLHAPYLLDHEIVSVALKKERLGWSLDSVPVEDILAIELYSASGDATHTLERGWPSNAPCGDALNAGTVPENRTNSSGIAKWAVIWVK